MDMTAVKNAFASIAARGDLVRNHHFDDGDDQGLYFNFTFGTPAPSLLWSVIWSTIYESSEFGAEMKMASMAMCSAEDGWDTYLQLYHFDPKVPREAV